MGDAGPAEATDGYRLGVDLGTTFTAAAVRRGDRVEMVTLGIRHPEMPSVIAITDDEIVVGEAAERRALIDPGSIAREFKRRIGDPTPLIVNSTPWSAEALTGRLLSHVLDQVATAESEPPVRLTVTHPANWGEYKLDHLREALLLADCEGAQLIPEPVAAAYYYAAQGRISPGQRLAVFDFGGGTLDTAIVHAKSHYDFDLVGQPKGLERLGGVDLDYALFAHVLTLAEVDLDTIEDTKSNRQAVGRLRSDCRDAKEYLSVDTSTAIPITLPSPHTDVRINRTEFEGLIRQRLSDATKVMKANINEAGLQTTDIDGVLLVGGTSRIPIVSQVIGEDLRLPVFADAHPKHSIAAGATHAPTEPDAPPRSSASAAVTLPPNAGSHDPAPVRAGAGVVKGLLPEDRTDHEQSVEAIDDNGEIHGGDSGPGRLTAPDWTSIGPSLGLPPGRPVRSDDATEDDHTAQRASLRSWLVLGAAAAVLIGGAAITFSIARQPDTSATPATDSVSTIATTGATETSTSITNAEGTENQRATQGTYVVTGRIRVGARPTTPVFAGNSIWVANLGEGTVSRINPLTDQVTNTISVGTEPATPTFAEGTLWVPNSADGTVSRVDPGSNSVTDTIIVGASPATPLYAGGAIWVTNRGDATVSRVEPSTNQVISTISVGVDPWWPVLADDDIWIANLGSDTVSRIDPNTDQVVATILVGDGPDLPLVAEGALWVANSLSGTVMRIDPGTNQVTTSIVVGAEPWTPTFAAGSVWVSNHGDGTVSRIDPVSNDVTQTLSVGAGPRTPVFAFNALWVTNSEDGTVTRIDPGTVEVTDTIFVGTDARTPGVSDSALWISNFGDGTVSRIEVVSG